MSFNPLCYESIDKNEINNDCHYHECSYITADRFKSIMPLSNSTFTCLNVNIRRVSKNFDKLKKCLKLTNHDYTVIGLTETTFREKPHEYRLCQKKLYNFQFLIAEKVNKSRQQHSRGQKHDFPVCKKILKWYHSMVRCKYYGPLSVEW